MNLDEKYRLAAETLMTADALLIGAGAGMGVDSGLPDFRGPEGFWKAYPPFRGRRFSDMSTPHWFQTDPQLAWGFFGHRLNLYRTTIPHQGFQILRKWAERFPRGSFVFTSNVDGQFQKAGFSNDCVVECHGSIHHLQCTGPCRNDVWPAGDLKLEVDMQTIRTTSTVPRCPDCGEIARPNILMFGDSAWIGDRTQDQWQSWQKWLRTANSGRLVTVELGAGLAVPTVRIECQRQPGALIRVNPAEAEVARGGISLPVGALTALLAIDDEINRVEN
jgi:NAD-dependent SIR2 family protein deacetylase